MSKSILSFVNLLKTDFRDFAGIANLDYVNLVDEARSYLSRTKDKYSIIQMSLIDTWAATGAGAFSLTENALYTVEAWKVFLERLKDDGIFTVSRWHSPKNVGETGRVLSLAVASLLSEGVADPSRHIAMVTTDNISTLLLSKQPFRPQDIERLKEIGRGLLYHLAIVPGDPPGNRVLGDIVSARSLEGLKAAISDKALNYEPTTDENPYFFNMLRLSHLGAVSISDEGVAKGNLVATLTLLGLIASLFILTIATIAIPLAAKVRAEQPGTGQTGILWSGALYFSLIGSGFMLVEIALMQRLSVFLGHPVYALGILLFSIIASTGAGSFIS